MASVVGEHAVLGEPLDAHGHDLGCSRPGRWFRQAILAGAGLAGLPALDMTGGHDRTP